jgi:hypothetical protein
MISKIVRRTTTCWLLVAIGCVTGRGGSLSAVGGRDWGEILAQAEAAATDHRYADADRMLADFAARYPGTQGATESAYWRGVIALEPANRDGSPQIAAALFESYNRSGGAVPHRVEAEILQHLAARLQSGGLATVASAAPAISSSGGAGDRSADLKARDTEIQRLKDELAKANDELERIKRRLTAPTKP